MIHPATRAEVVRTLTQVHTMNPEGVPAGMLVLMFAAIVSRPALDTANLILQSLLYEGMLETEDGGKIETGQGNKIVRLSEKARTALTEARRGQPNEAAPSDAEAVERFLATLQADERAEQQHRRDLH